MPTMNKVDLLDCAAGHHNYADGAAECSVCGHRDASELRSYRVEWTIDIDGATSPEDAARQAFAHMQRPGTTANAFDVYEKDGTGEPVHVDLMEVGVEPT